MPVAGSKKPQILEYSNYRLFLRDFYVTRKDENPGFSFRVFSRMAGFASPNFLKLVMDGKRNLSVESIDQVIRALKLTVEEAAFLRNLVQLNQALTSEQKRHFAERIVASRAFRKLQPLRQAQFEYYSEWYHVAVRELVALEGFVEDPAWIAGALRPEIGVVEARKSLELLQRLGMVRRDGSGRLVQAESLVTSGDEVTNASVARFHQQMIGKGAESIERFRSQERDISSLTLGLSEAGAKQIKEMIQKFRKELLAVANNDRGLERVYQANFQFFPLSNKKEHGE